jgi:hypothetical protein
MKRHKRTFIVLSVLLLIAGVLPFLIPLNASIPAIERQATASLRQPVTIERVGFTLLPLPALTAGGIVIGKAQEIKIADINVNPDWLSLLKSVKVIDGVKVDGIEITQAGIGMLAVLGEDLAASSATTPAARLEDGEIKLNKVLLKLEGATAGPFNVVAQFNDAGLLAALTAASADGNLKVVLDPDPAGFRIAASGKDWQLPTARPIKFDELAIAGIADGKHIELSKIEGRLYQGVFTGRARMTWASGMQLTGHVDAAQLDLASLVPVIAPKVKMAGRLNAKTEFSALFKEVQEFSNALRIRSDFSIQDGIYYGLDIAQAATSFLKSGSTGGETKFNQLSGKLARTQGAYQFSNLKISSGLLAANGNVSISPREELSGRINAKVLTAKSPSIPLNVTGTLANPVLFPTRAAMAGAAIGTIMMPGVGTGVGIKAGDFIDNLFGGGEEKKKKK